MKSFEVYEKYPNSKKSLVEIEKLINSIKNHIQIEETVFFSIHLCIHEIFMNAIYHGNKSDISKFVEVYAFIEKEVLTVKITDQGEGFDVANISNPLEEENRFKESGRGIFLTLHYTNSLQYEKTNRGFCATLTFDLASLKNTN